MVEPRFPEIDWPSRPTAKRPVFISYSTDDFRVAYALLTCLCTVDECQARQIVLDTPRAGQLPHDLDGQVGHVDDG